MDLVSGVGIDGAYLVKPDIHTDERGFFCEVSNTAIVPGAEFSRFCVTRSGRGVLRGLHARPLPGEAKLVRCSAGTIYDVAVDLRPDSPTFRRWQAFGLTGESLISLHIPAGCAHGYQALTDQAEVTYRIDAPYEPGADLVIAWDDPELAIPWPLPVTVMSAQDAEGGLSLANAVNLI